MPNRPASSPTSTISGTTSGLSAERPTAAASATSIASGIAADGPATWAMIIIAVASARSRLPKNQRDPVITRTAPPESRSALSTGDAIWGEDRVWQAVILGESNPQAFLDTLTLLRDLDFHVLVPWPAQRHEEPYDIVTVEQKREQIDNLIARITAGASGSAPEPASTCVQATAGTPGSARAASQRDHIEEKAVRGVRSASQCPDAGCLHHNADGCCPYGEPLHGALIAADVR